MGNFPFSVQDVLLINGLPVPQGKQNIDDLLCPNCGKKHLGFSFKKQVGHCFGCGSNYNAVTFHRELNPGMDGKTAYKDILARAGIESSYAPRQQEREPVSVDAPIADIAARDHTYRMMISQLSLSKDHKEDLQRRGMENIHYVTADFRTKEVRDKIVEDLLARGCQLTGVPGFYQDSMGNWRMQFAKRGIVVPYIDSEGRIQGIQIRKDDALRETRSDGKLEPKYSWYSSSTVPKGCTGGTRSKTFVHYACDFLFDHGNLKPLIKDHTVYLTEGAMKADIAHQLSGYSFVAVPGVTCLEQLKNEFPVLRSIGVQKVIIAYDMDRVSNINVGAALRNMQSVFKTAGFECEIARWANEYVAFDKTHAFIDPDTQFVVTPDKEESFLRRRDAFGKLKSMGIKTILYSFEDSDEARASRQDYARFHHICRLNGLSCQPVFWRLRLKGVDDYLAYKEKGIYDVK